MHRKFGLPSYPYCLLILSNPKSVRHNRTISPKHGQGTIGCNIMFVYNGVIPDYLIAKIPMARPNESDMTPKATKKMRLGISVKWAWHTVAISGQWLDIVGCFGLVYCEFGYDNWTNLHKHDSWECLRLGTVKIATIRSEGLLRSQVNFCYFIGSKMARDIRDTI